MRIDHLTPDELEGLARGETPFPDVFEHLGACAECREAARATAFGARYVRPLASGHPDEDVLMALWARALSPSRQAEVRTHVQTCSRCRSLLMRLERATPERAHPDRVSEAAIRSAQARVLAPTGPRRATLAVRAAEGMKRLRAFVVDLTEPLGSEDFSPALSRWSGALAAEDRVFRARMEEPGPRSEATTLSDGECSVRFEPRRGERGPQLAVTVALRRFSGPASVAAVLESGGHPPQGGEIATGGEAVFDLHPGSSRLVLELSPPWFIEIRLDA